MAAAAAACRQLSTSINSLQQHHLVRQFMCLLLIRCCYNRQTNTRQLRQVIFPQLYKQMFEKMVCIVDEVVAIHTWRMGSQRPFRRMAKGGGAVAMVLGGG